MNPTRLKILALLGTAALLCTPVFGENQPMPGALNYVEGSVFLEGHPLTNKDVGSSILNPGEILSTGAGKAEILLTPGVFLRVGDHSAVKMISPDLTLTQVELERGRTGVEVDEIHSQNDLQIIDGGVATQLVKNGYYEFVANNPTALVFKGKAAVEVSDGKYKVVKGHHEFALTEPDGRPLAKEKPENFNSRDAQDDLYKWSSLRSQYLAEDNNEIAGEYAGASGFYPGWYWDPYAWDYTFIGMDPYWSPFGWGFYPPWWGGFYGGYYGGYGYYGNGYGGERRYGNGFHGQNRFGVGGVHGGPVHSGGFRAGGFSGFHGGGFGGGFHGGGGFGGGFHGGGGRR